MKMVLMDIFGNKINAKLLFTHFDYNFSKNYIVYTVDNDLLAASYEIVNDKYVIDCDLSSKEYDMIDEVIAKEVGGSYA